MSEEIIRVRGNNCLSGSVKVAGAKNSALKLIAASILGQGRTTLYNIPEISDIALMLKVLESLGARVDRKEGSVSLDTTNLNATEAPYELVSKMRASIAVLGPLLARCGHARVAMPGGCQIGARKIDMHLRGLEALGVKFQVDHGYLDARVEGVLRANTVNLDFPSVGATENLMMAAVVAQGTTYINNAAQEPEIEDLANMLNAMGARISGAGSTTISIEGVPLASLHPCEHQTIGDRIEAGTFLVGAALTGGPLCVEGINPQHLRMALAKLEEMGCEINTTNASICLKRTQPLKAITLQTLPHPGFPTDLQAQFMLLAALAQGCSHITENVFENRFMFASELMRMGADIRIQDHHAQVAGPTPLQGAPVSSTDLRAGAALVLAGVVAHGITEVHNIEHIDRGYERYVEKLQSLGACVERITLES